MTLRQRIIVQVDAELAKNGVLDAAGTPEDLAVINRYRRILIENVEATVKLGPVPKP